MRLLTISLAICAFATLTATTSAQVDALDESLGSPVQGGGEPYRAGPAIACSLALPSDATLYDTDHSGGTFIVNELRSPFRVFAYDEDCNLLSSWNQIGVLGTRATGIGFSHAGNTYWLADSGRDWLIEFHVGTGVPTGYLLPEPGGGISWGALVVDDNQPGEVLCINEIVLDSTYCIDTEMRGSLICLYPNQDAIPAHGDGISDAVTPSDCSGQTLVNASGPNTAQTATRAGQYDCTGNDPTCTDRWDLTVASTPAGICEFAAADGSRNLMLVDSAFSIVYRLVAPRDIMACQDKDPNMDVVWINGSRGGSDLTVRVPAESQFAVGIQRTPAGSGRFIHHMNPGSPTPSTIVSLFDLGNACFPFLGGSPVVVENNVGRTDLVGASRYFGTPIADPAPAPTFLASLTQASIDAGNLPAGARFTHQLLAVNAAASSSKGGSLSNAVVIEMQ